MNVYIPYTPEEVSIGSAHFERLSGYRASFFCLPFFFSWESPRFGPTSDYLTDWTLH